MDPQAAGFETAAQSGLASETILTFNDRKYDLRIAKVLSEIMYLFFMLKDLSMLSALLLR